ncbi:hypothetical protein Vadar_033361 [Vaccinium darrowii]|uniref:Uncharacterized protein n=1 Tax=Vaccinium darrowii TaxID=229202 RepID=A0ACB7Z0P9_9ERIC|nr:hypothetical protein Vadar_033361 [Vaccinium darrowii]
MLATAIEYRDVFSRLKIRENQYKSCPKDTDWDVAKEVCERLEVYYKAIEVFNAKKVSNLKLVFCKVCKIKMALTDWAKIYESNEVEDMYTMKKREMMRDMASKMIEKYDKYWTTIHGILGVAAVLDPRFKMKLVEYYFNRIYGVAALFEVEKVVDYCRELFNEYEVKLSNGARTSPCQVDSSTNAEDDDLSDFDLFVSSNKGCKVSSTKSELDLYLEEDVLPRGGNSTEFASVVDDMDVDGSQSCVMHLCGSVDIALLIIDDLEHCHYLRAPQLDLYKERIWQEVKDNTNVPEVYKHNCLMFVSKKWRDWKDYLKRYHYDAYKTDAERLDNCPVRVDSDQWSILVAFWGGQCAKERSDRNLANRQFQKMGHTSGRKSHCRVRAGLAKEKEVETNEVDRIEVFEKTHTNKDGNPVDNDSATAMLQMDDEI